MVTQSVLRPEEDEEPSQAYQSYRPAQAYQPLRSQDVLGNKRRQVAAARNLQDSNVATGLLQNVDKPEPVDLGHNFEPEIDETLAMRIIKQKKEARGRPGWTGLPVVSQVLDAAEWYDTNIQRHLDSLALGAVGTVTNPAGSALALGQSVLGKAPEDNTQPDAPITSLGSLGPRYWANLFENVAEIFQVNDDEYDGPIGEFLEILPETYDETHTPKYTKGLIELLNPADPLGWVTFKVGGKLAKPFFKGAGQHVRGLYNWKENRVRVQEQELPKEKRVYSQLPDIRVIETGHEADVAAKITEAIEDGTWFPIADDYSNGPVTQMFQRWWPALDIINPLAKTNPKALLRHRAGRAVMELNWDLQQSKSSAHTLAERFLGMPKYRDDVPDTLLLSDKGLSIFQQTTGPAGGVFWHKIRNDTFTFAIDQENNVANTLTDSALYRRAQTARTDADGKVVGDNKHLLNMQYLYEYYKRGKRTDGSPLDEEELKKVKEVNDALTNTQKAAFDMVLDVQSEIRGFLLENGFSEKILHRFDPEEYRFRSVKESPEMRGRDRDRDLRMMQADALGYFDDEMFEPRLVEKIEDALTQGVVYDEVFETAVQRWEAAQRAVAWKKFMTRMGNIADRNVAAEVAQESTIIQMFDNITDSIQSIAPVRDRGGNVVRAADRFYEAVSTGDDKLLNEVIADTSEMFRKIDEDLGKTEYAGESVRNQIQDALNLMGKIAKMDVETSKHLLIADNFTNLLSRGDTLSILTDDTTKVIQSLGNREMKETLRKLKRIGNYRNRSSALRAEIEDLDARIADWTANREARWSRRMERIEKYTAERDRKIKLLERLQRDIGEKRGVIPEGANPKTYKADYTTDFTDSEVIRLREQFVQMFADETDLRRFPTSVDKGLKFLRNKKGSRAEEARAWLLERRGVSNARKQTLVKLDEMRKRIKSME